MPLGSDSSAELGGLTPAQAAELEFYHSYENWLKLHRSQFESMNLPPSLYRKLFDKIYNETFDSAEFFEIHAIETEEENLKNSNNEENSEEEGNEEEKELPIHYELAVKSDLESPLKSNFDIFLIDHIWKFSNENGILQLKNSPELVEKLWNLMEMDRRIMEEEKEKSESEMENVTKLMEESALCPAESVSIVMQQTGVSRERAILALKSENGDLIEAINSIHPDEARIHETRQTENSNISTVDVSTLSEFDRKVKIVWESLFKYQYAGLYYTMLPRAEGVRGPVRPEEVDAIYFVNDEIGSAVRTSINSNCSMAPFVCVTLAGQSFTLMWITKDAQPGEEILKPVRPAVKMPVEFSVQ